MRCWSTVGSDEPITGACLLEICEVHLLYIGQHMYGELKLCPFVPVMGQAVTEAPNIYIPPKDSDSECIEAIDLSNKPDTSNAIPETMYSIDIDDVSHGCNDHLDGISSPCSVNAEFLDNTPTDSSDTPSESLLSPPIGRTDKFNHVLGTNTAADSDANNTPAENPIVDVSIVNNPYANDLHVPEDSDKSHGHQMSIPESCGNFSESDIAKPHVNLDNPQNSALGINSPTEVNVKGTNPIPHCEDVIGVNNDMPDPPTEMNVKGTNPIPHCEDVIGVNNDKPDLCVMGNNSALEPHVMGSNHDTHSGNVIEMHTESSDTPDPCVMGNNRTAESCVMGSNPTTQMASVMDTHTNITQSEVINENLCNVTEPADVTISTHCYDTYNDGPLSGALDRIHMDTAEILCTLATLQLHEGASCPTQDNQPTPSEVITHPDSEEDPRNLDHTYSNSDTSHVVADKCVQDHCYSANTTNELIHETSSDAQQTNTLTIELFKTLIDDTDELERETCVIDPNGFNLCRQISYVSHPSNTISTEDTSKEVQPTTEKINQTNALGTNIMDVDITLPPLDSTNVLTAAQPLNTMEHMDIQQDMLGTNNKGDLDSISDRNFTYDENANTSTDTIPYADEMNNIEPNPETTLQDLLLVRDRHNTPIPSVAKLWRNDALSRRWTVPLKNLSKVDIYMLSQPGPKWDDIDPYSGLEEVNVPDNETTNVEINSAKPNSMMKTTKPAIKNDIYHLWKRASPKSVIRKSRRTWNAVARYVEIESCSSSNNSDYTPKPKYMKRPQIGLREPSKNRIRAQQIINASRNNRQSRILNTNPKNNPPHTTFIEC